MCPPAAYERVARSGTQTDERLEPVRIWLLGGFRVSVGPQTIEPSEWRLRKAASLVKLLALAPHHRLHREQVMDRLWPGSGKRSASNNLRQIVHTTRKILDPVAGSRYLQSDNDSLVLCPAGEIWVDVEAFEEAAATAQRSKDPAAYRAALALYAGELLPEDRYEEWAQDRREVVRRSYLDLLVALAGAHEERGEHGPAVEVLRRAIAEEPTNDEAHAGLMRLYALSGQQGEALAQYGRLQDLLSREIGTEPGAAARRLHEEIATGAFITAGTSPVGHLPEAPAANGDHNLPAPRSSFVGREREMVEVKRELAMTRLLTLTGAGGSGKTRLALEVVRSLVGAYPDGVWLVELAPISAAELLPQAVAKALEVPERPGQPLTDTLIRAMRRKRLLLVLDNCEHLLDAAAELVNALLDACPGLRILATSREMLKVAGEMIQQVLPLEVPPPSYKLTVAELEGAEAARLFLERARHRDPSFILAPENAKAVGEVCWRLAGMPLAIELAAARVGALSVEQIERKLKGSLDLLGDGGRIAPERHRTLRGALDWSYGLLSKSEQTLFRRLSVFAGGWTLEAAEAVGERACVERADITDLLSGLVDKSLVVAETSTHSGPRYRLLEPVRQYARDKLEVGQEGEAVRRRHATFFLVLAEEADPGVEGAQQAAWLERLETEHDNIRAALSWSLEHSEEAGLALRMGAALGEFWYLRGYFGEGRRWLEEALAQSSPAPTAARARALHRVSWLALLQGNLDRAEEASEEGLALEGVELLRTGSGDSIAAELQRVLGMVVGTRGELERETELLEESLALSREAGSHRGMAGSIFILGISWRTRGDPERATRLLEEALTMLREAGDQALIASVLTHLGYTSLLQGDLERATAISEEAAVMLREQNHRSYLADVLVNLGWVALLRGDSERARALFAESLGLRREVGNVDAVPETLNGLACAEGVRGEAERAATLFGTAEALRETMDYQQESGERKLQEPYLVAARSQLDEAAWERAWKEGKAMGLEEAVEYALSEDEPARSAPLTPAQHITDKTSMLTRREGEVASLVAQRLTNRQIASELVLSERTVDHHVASILKKLGLRSREQVASRLGGR
jgi:predicted ATPase/DNA-binding SARP family transcriptional activator/DNA-binding CsgD family transcriptional regulator